MPAEIKEYRELWKRIRDGRPKEVAIFVHPDDEYTVRRMIQKKRTSDALFNHQIAELNQRWKLKIRTERTAEGQVRMIFSIFQYGLFGKL